MIAAAGVVWDELRKRRIVAMLKSDNTSIYLLDTLMNGLESEFPAEILAVRTRGTAPDAGETEPQDG